MRMLAQILRWESELASVIVPDTHLPQALDAILSAAVGGAVEAGHALAGGRASPEKLFPLLDMIACMHDPYVLPSMKAAFRQPALSASKDKFHALLAALCSAAQAAVHSFTASLTGDAAPARKEAAAVTTVSQQTAFALRFLKACLGTPRRVALFAAVMAKCTRKMIAAAADGSQRETLTCCYAELVSRRAEG